jgi:nucleotide sugar dehydrogenase
MENMMIYIMKVGIIGVGFVGGAMKKSFEMKEQTVIAYDKFKDLDTFEDTLNCDIIFLCLPTLFNEETNEYDKTPMHEICGKLEKGNYSGLVVIKSTVEPQTTNIFGAKYQSLKFIHNPEFLTAATAFEDFHNQTHIVLGKGPNVTHEDMKPLVRLYKELYPTAEMSLCSCTESESMKSFVNCFYSVKVQFFNELYLTCKANGCDYDIVKELMLKNKWINPMHTDVPGPDGQLSYGGYCFPKDTNALLQHMKNRDVPHEVLEATISERNKMRDDHTNVIKK